MPSYNVIQNGFVMETVDWDGKGELPAALQRGKCILQEIKRPVRLSIEQRLSKLEEKL